MNILKAAKLSKKYSHPVSLTILKEINLEVAQGETVAIMGPSGVGKSTLLHILGTLEAPTDGELIIAGKSTQTTSNSQLRNQHIGFIFQNYNLLEEYTAMDNLMMPARIGRKKENLKRAHELLDRVNLLDRKDFLAKLLSGGEKQRLAIARALYNDPELILADEPTGNLDDEHSQNIHNLLLGAAKDFNKSLIVVTHNHDLAKLCDRQYLLRDGILV